MQLTALRAAADRQDVSRFSLQPRDEAMISDDLNRSLPSLFRELVYGAPAAGAFVLNPGDVGLLATLDGLSAVEASRSSSEGATIAAHVDHVRFGLSLMNRWAAGEENPFAGADWTAAWKRRTVSEAEWAELRKALRGDVERWEAALQEPRKVTGIELDGVIGSVVHLAYHLGAIRQIAPGARGPRASASP
jgi:hypothetical protein